MTYVGDKIKEYRKKRGITQAKLAELTGIHPVSIRKYEVGMMEPQLQQIQRIADALEINVFMLQEEPHPKLRLNTEDDVLEVVQYLIALGVIETENEKFEYQLHPKLKKYLQFQLSEI